jgi:hypothetical protein
VVSAAGPDGLSLDGYILEPQDLEYALPHEHWSVSISNAVIRGGLDLNVGPRVNVTKDAAEIKPKLDAANRLYSRIDTAKLGNTMLRWGSTGHHSFFFDHSVPIIYSRVTLSNVRFESNFDDSHAQLRHPEIIGEDVIILGPITLANVVGLDRFSLSNAFIRFPIEISQSDIGSLTLSGTWLLGGLHLNDTNAADRQSAIDKEPALLAQIFAAPRVEDHVRQRVAGFARSVDQVIVVELIDQILQKEGTAARTHPPRREWASYCWRGAARTGADGVRVPKS